MIFHNDAFMFGIISGNSQVCDAEEKIGSKSFCHPFEICRFQVVRHSDVECSIPYIRHLVPEKTNCLKRADCPELGGCSQFLTGLLP